MNSNFRYIPRIRQNESLGTKERNSYCLVNFVSSVYSPYLLPFIRTGGQTVFFLASKTVIFDELNDQKSNNFEMLYAL